METGKKHIENAIMAARVWNEFDGTMKDRLKKYFHLRPTSSGVTIVSTLPVAPMRGLNNIKTEDDLRRKLKTIDDDFQQITAKKDEKAEVALKELGFKKRDGNKCVPLEEYYQAIMINMMNKEDGHKIFGNATPIKFVASEFIFEKGSHKIDIVGHDKKDLYFFELKKERTFKVEQVSDYVKYYSEKKSILDDLLSNYPINPIKFKYEKIKGVMVMRHAENSFDRKEWRQLEKKHDIKILFYKPSLEFESPIKDDK